MPAWSDESWRVWRFTSGKPIAGAPVEVLDTDRTTVRLRADGPAEVELEVHWSRWLSVTGPACVERAGDRTRIRFTGAGEAVVGSRLAWEPPGQC